MLDTASKVITEPQGNFSVFCSATRVVIVVDEFEK